MLGFGTMKVLEYSIMSSAMEMIYMPMGQDVSYLPALPYIALPISSPSLLGASIRCHYTPWFLISPHSNPYPLPLSLYLSRYNSITAMMDSTHR